jgi:hypothetical protein
MGYDLTVQGLIRKRADLAGQVETMNARLTATMAQLHALDTAIRVFKPEIDLDDLPERAAPPPFSGFRGEIQRFLLDELRKANAPQSTFDLADKIMDRRGLDRSDKIATNLIRRRTGYALAKLRKKGRATSWRAHPSAPLLWELSPTRA